MDNRPIGIFDSGFGGLTALRALRALLPEENILYFGDTGRMPYGEKSPAQLRRMAVQDLDLMAGLDVKAILVACGTLSSSAADLIAAYPIPAFGVLQPGIEAMAGVGSEGPLGVIATEASIRSGAYAAGLAARCPGRQVIPIACPDFVPLIEAGHSTPADPLLREAAARYLPPLRGAAAVLLGCTHYGLIEETLRACLGDETVLVSASACGARALRDYLQENRMTGGTGETRFFTSGSGADFAAAAAVFLECALPEAAEELPVMPV